MYARPTTSTHPYLPANEPEQAGARFDALRELYDVGGFRHLTDAVAHPAARRPEAANVAQTATAIVTDGHATAADIDAHLAALDGEIDT